MTSSSMSLVDSFGHISVEADCEADASPDEACDSVLVPAGLLFLPELLVLMLSALLTSALVPWLGNFAAAATTDKMLASDPLAAACSACPDAVADAVVSKEATSSDSNRSNNASDSLAVIRLASDAAAGDLGQLGLLWAGLALATAAALLLPACLLRLAAVSSSASASRPWGGMGACVPVSCLK
jgi:hypothetical protein